MHWDMCIHASVPTMSSSPCTTLPWINTISPVGTLPKPKPLSTKHLSTVKCVFTRDLVYLLRFPLVMLMQLASEVHDFFPIRRLRREMTNVKHQTTSACTTLEVTFLQLTTMSMVMSFCIATCRPPGDQITCHQNSDRTHLHTRPIHTIGAPMAATRGFFTSDSHARKSSSVSTRFRLS